MEINPFPRSIYNIYEEKIYPRIKHIRGSHRLLMLLSNYYTGMEKIDESPTPIRNLEWDNLIILDACRYDLYQELRPQTDYRISLGSHSADFVQKNFSTGDWSDTVVVTANPHYTEQIFSDLTGRNPDDVFACVFEVFMTDWHHMGTVKPEDMISQYETARKLYPEKKIIIHFMQPHKPFIGSQLREEYDVDGIGRITEQGSVERTEWDLGKEGIVSDDRLWKAYRETLGYALEEIENFDWSGRTVITSDHGNWVGERGLYDHPRGRKEKLLRKVPLVVFDED